MVRMSEQRFDPSALVVEIGQTVSFVNTSGEAHTVTAEAASLPDDARYFASGGFSTERAARADLPGGLIEPGGRYEVTFAESGTYRYVCIPHEDLGMTGTIEVKS